MPCINTFIEETDTGNKEEDEVLDFVYDCDKDSENKEFSGREIDAISEKEEDVDLGTLFTRTRSGRLAGSWRV